VKQRPARQFISRFGVAMRMAKKIRSCTGWIACLGAVFLGTLLQVTAQQAAAPENGNSITAGGTLLANAARPTSGMSASEVSSAEGLPDSPSATLAQDQEQQNSSPAAQTPNGTSTSQSQTQPSAQKPVGTATADAPDATGIAASQPAGVAIAPAKQKRARTLVLKVGAILAGAAAVGAVIALTEATSSRPPGAH
jgi:hypothetical protein